MKKLIFFALTLIGLCTLFSSCSEEDFEAIMAPIPKDYKSFADKGLGFAYEGMTLDGDTVVFLGAKLKETTIPVAPDSLLKVSLLQDLPIQKNESSGLITAHQTFLSDDGQETYLSLRAKAPEHLLEFMKLKSGYRDYYFDWSEPTPIAIGDIAQITEHIKPMLIDSEGQTIGNIPALEPWYYHVTVKPDPVEPEPEPLTVVVDTMYFYEGPEGFLKIHAARTNSSRTIYEVFIDQQLPLYGDGRFYGTDVWHAVAPARFDSSVGNNGLKMSIEPQPDRSYTGKVEDEYITSAQSYNCCRISTAFVNDGDGTATTECVIDYWTKEYQFHDPVTGWSMKTHPIELTHKVTRNELTQVDGSRNDRYGKPHHEIATLATEVTSTLILNGKEEDVNHSSGISHISEWREK